VSNKAGNYKDKQFKSGGGKMKERCSFCGTEESDAVLLIGKRNQNAYICETCWKTVGMLMGKAPKLTRCGDNTVRKEPERNNNWGSLSPVKIKQNLDQYIIGQDHAKKVLSVAVYNHYKSLDAMKEETDKNGKTEVEKSNILMVGPTGVGKTAIIRALAKMLQVPFAISDATTMTSSGYVGDDPDTCIQRLLQAAEGDVKKAETGIVYIDEIDKIACKGDSRSHRDIGGECVQQALLKIIEGSVVDGVWDDNNGEPVSVDTSHILFIVGGAFAGIDGIIRERIIEPETRHPAGFCSEDRQKPDKQDNRDVSFNSVIDRVMQEDLHEFGMIPELLGRLPVIAPLHELGREDYCRILTEPRNALVKQYQEIFRRDNIDLAFSSDALEAIADKAVQSGTGARGLRSIMEQVLLDKMYNIRENQTGTRLLVTSAEVLNISSHSARQQNVC
jgi:ATP-dependent Clp protease ATP-binding subunit ClpX